MGWHDVVHGATIAAETATPTATMLLVAQRLPSHKRGLLISSMLQLVLCLSQFRLLSLRLVQDLSALVHSEQSWRSKRDRAYSAAGTTASSRKRMGGVAGAGWITRLACCALILR